MTTQQTPSLQDMLAMMAQQQQMIQQLMQAVVPTQTDVLDTVAESVAPSQPTEPAGTYFVGTVSRVAAHKIGLQMKESGDRYWNVAKSLRSKIDYNGIEDGMVIRLTLDAPDAPDHTARVIGWAPADAPMPTKGKGKPAKGANNGRGQNSKGKGAASAAPAPTVQAAAPAPTLTAREQLTAKAASMVTKHRAANGVDGSCPFCKGKHNKYTDWQISFSCLSGQFASAGRPLNLMNPADVRLLGDYLLSHAVPVYSYNAAGFEIIGVTAEEAAQSTDPKVSTPPSVQEAAQSTDPKAPAASSAAPTTTTARTSAPKDISPSKPAPKTCGADGCSRWIARELDYCAKHATDKAREARKAATPKIVTKEDAVSGDITFRAIIVQFPTQKTRMVKLIKLDGSGEQWFEYEATLDIAQCAPGTVVDARVRQQPDSKSVVLVAYTVVAPPAMTEGVQTSGKQQAPASRTKTVSNRQRNAARKERAAKTEAKQETPADEIEWKELPGGFADVDAQLEAISARRRLAALAKSNPPVRMTKVMPGITVKEDKNGVPQFVVEGSRKAAAARRKNKPPTGVIGPECVQCGRRFSMAGYSSRPGVCGRCEAEESEPNV